MGEWGAQHRYAKQLFQAVIAPRTDYGAVIWHRSKQNESTASTMQCKRLTIIQRLIMKAITDCYRITSTTAMKIEINLQFAWIWFQTKTLLTVTRMQTLFTRHSIHELITNALRVRISKIRHRFNLESIFQQFSQLTETTETIESFIQSSWWLSKTQIQISGSKNEIKK